MKPFISLFICLILLICLLPLRANTAAPAAPDPAKISAKVPSPLPPEKRNVDGVTAAILGLVCFGASVTATVIILKGKRNEVILS